MKPTAHKITLLFVVSMLLLFSSTGASAFVFDVTYNCTTPECIEGTPATWNVEINNEGGRFQEIIGIDIVNAVSRTVAASFRTTFNPEQDERGTVILLNGLSSITIPVPADMVGPNMVDNRFVFYPCFVTVVREPLEVARTGKHERTFCYSQNFSMPAFSCLESKHCAEDHYCSQNQCLPLDCPECSFIQDHTCKNYECCASSDCSTSQLCNNNTCQNIFCSPNQYLFNRTCVDLNCGPDEIIENKACKKLDCKFNEYASNHTCKPLSCKDNEYIGNHQCLRLDCAYNEHPVNHACEPLLCKDNEAYVNHACEPLSCSFISVIDKHQCKVDWILTAKLVVELIVVGLIIYFLLLDYKKHKARLLKKQRLEQENKKT